MIISFYFRERVNKSRHIGFIYPLISHEKSSSRKCTYELMEWLKAFASGCRFFAHRPQNRGMWAAKRDVIYRQISAEKLITNWKTEDKPTFAHFKGKREESSARAAPNQGCDCKGAGGSEIWQNTFTTHTKKPIPTFTGKNGQTTYLYRE